MTKIAVGSKNPVKIAAVESASKKIWPEVKIISVEVDSGVSEQPMADDEAIEGAVNRARLALRGTGADIGVGLEACVIDSRHGMLISGWTVAIDQGGKIGMGCSGSFLLPEKIAVEIRKGRELGPVIDEFTAGHNTKQKQGAVGIFTNNLITRTEACEKSVIYAFTRFINPDYYVL